MWAIVGQIVIAALAAYENWQQASEADKAELEARAAASLNELLGVKRQTQDAHDTRTNETIKIIHGASQK